jgi:hypothetical protein
MFYRGDIICCVDPNGVLTLNRSYAVLAGGSDPTIINDLGFEANYRGDRFSLVEPVSRHKSEVGYPKKRRALFQMTDWQPIETAPKDGTRIIAALFGWALPRNCAAKDFFDSTLPREYQCFFALTAYWHDDHWSNGLERIREPTHWMPLPAPPQNDQVD